MGLKKAREGVKEKPEKEEYGLRTAHIREELSTNDEMTLLS